MSICKVALNKCTNRNAWMLMCSLHLDDRSDELGMPRGSHHQMSSSNVYSTAEKNTVASFKNLQSSLNKCTRSNRALTEINHTWCWSFEKLFNTVEADAISEPCLLKLLKHKRLASVAFCKRSYFLLNHVSVTLSHSFKDWDSIGGLCWIN